jgi:metal-responsive CopG/Arc/MetJ family transcriptional regulator
MKVKTSITLSEEIVKQIDYYSTQTSNRSTFIETAVKIYIDQMKRKIRDENDARIYLENMDTLNKEAEDVLEYQIPV